MSSGELTMDCSYQITPRPLDLGGDWRLRILEDKQEVGGGAFPLLQEDALQGIVWWNQIHELERGQWLTVAESAVPADARIAYLLAEARADAESVAYDWLGSRDAPEDPQSVPKDAHRPVTPTNL